MEEDRTENYKLTIYEAYLKLASNIKENSSYNIEFEEMQSCSESLVVANIWVEPKQTTFFTSKIGPIKSVELFALLIKIKAQVDGSQLKISIISHFNPSEYNQKQLPFNAPGHIVTSGSQNHLNKVFNVLDEAPKIIKNDFHSWITEALSFYFGL